MLNHISIATLAAARFGTAFVRPAYGSYCFAHLPDTVRALFGLPAAQPLPPDVLPDPGGWDRVILVLVDAFGWQIFERLADHAPLLRELSQHGVVSQLTAQFPSTTAAHVTCLHTGLDVSASGVHEWFYYEPQLDMIFTPLMFAPAGDQRRDVLADAGVAPALVFPDATIYRNLEPAGVKCYVIQHREYARSAYSDHVTRGAELLAYHTLPEALTNLRLLLTRHKGPLYAFVYFASIDTVGHRYGPDSPHTEAEASLFLTALEQFVRAYRGQGRRTLLLVTADHGQVRIDPGTTLYLNQVLPHLEASLRRDRRGRPLRFGGAARDLFLYVRPDRLDEIEAQLKQALGGRAEVHRTATLAGEGLFGSLPIGERLRARLGDLVILPYDGESVYWYEQGRFEQVFFGHHGGLTAGEMHVPLIAYEL